jgi:hypothetical protein
MTTLVVLLAVAVLGLTAGTVLHIKLQKRFTPAFLTGSQAYGDAYRTAASDYDLVMFVDNNTFDDLKVLGQEEWNEVSDSSTYFGTRNVKSLRIKYGGLDLIVLKDVDDYHAWKKTTNILVQDKPATREEAKATFEAARTTGY